MAFNVSYNFQARDQFSAVARKVKKATSDLRSKIVQMGKTVTATGPKFRRLGDKIRRFGRSAVDNLGPKIRKLGTRIKSLGRSALDAGKRFSLFATVPIALLGRSLIKAASDAEETRSKFDTVFKDIGVKASTAADELASGFGLSGTKARELLGDTADLLSGFGFTQEAALDLSSQVNKLAVDLASFTNFSGGAEGASAALTKALLGERESIKSLGIAILEKDVVARVKQLVIVEKMTFASLRQAKAFATLQLAQEQSKNAIGDFARTSESFANKQRVLNARMQDFREGLGNILLPIATKIVVVMTELVEKFNGLSPAVKKTILVIGGVLAVAGPLLLIIGSLALVLPAIAAGFALAFSPVGVIIAGVVLAIAGIGFAISALRNNWTEISDVIGGTIAQIGVNFSSVFDGITGTINQIGVNIGSTFFDISSVISETISGISNSISTTIDLIATGFEIKFAEIKATIQSFTAGISGFFSSVGGNISSFFGIAQDKAETAVSNNQQLIQQQSSRADVNVNLRAPEGVVESVKTARSGNVRGMNLGVNMAMAGG